MGSKLLEDLRHWFRPETAPGPPAEEAIPAVEQHKRPLCFIVDDEDAISGLIARWLKGFEVDVEVYSDANTAVEALARRSPYLIFLDVTLGKSDAIEVIRALKQHQFSGGVQLMSGRDAALLEDVRRIGERHELRMRPVLQKPFRLEDIRAVAQEEGIRRVPGSVAPEPAKVPLAKVLGHDWLELWYQLKIDLQAKKIAGAEALVRARHPTRGVLLPESFLPGASDGDLASLTESVLQSVLRDWETFCQAGLNLKLAVDVPVSALNRVPISRIIQEHRPASEKWPGIMLEIAESEIVKDIPLAHEIATQLRIHDVQLVLDDFGAGYSAALSGLRELPFAELKLNRSFVANCAADKTNAGLCKTIIDLAHHFDSLAVADGIETAADLWALRRMGCNLGQGIRLSRPLPLDQMASALRKHRQRAA
jgi:EAL domain-containing protein (putative c-di-GMP-specific phosphodiesterase class I)